VGSLEWVSVPEEDSYGAINSRGGAISMPNRWKRYPQIVKPWHVSRLSLSMIARSVLQTRVEKLTLKNGVNAQCVRAALPDRHGTRRGSSLGEVNHRGKLAIDSSHLVKPRRLVLYKGPKNAHGAGGGTLL